MKYICIALIKFYRKYLSRLKGKATCRFYPTCSEYALAAYMKYNFFKASYLTLKRIIKCNPFNKGGFDPLP